MTRRVYLPGRNCLPGFSTLTCSFAIPFTSTVFTFATISVGSPKIFTTSAPKIFTFVNGPANTTLVPKKEVMSSSGVGAIGLLSKVVFKLSSIEFFSEGNIPSDCFTSSIFLFTDCSSGTIIIPLASPFVSCSFLSIVDRMSFVICCMIFSLSFVSSARLILYALSGNSKLFTKTPFGSLMISAFPLFTKSSISNIDRLGSPISKVGDSSELKSEIVVEDITPRFSSSISTTGNSLIFSKIPYSISI